VKLILIRHGESTWNIEGRYQGRCDPPLSERGVAQAHAVARRLKLESADQLPAAIVSSPLVRAVSTARIIASALDDLPVNTDTRLIEIDHGDWQGKLVAEVAQAWPDALAAWRTRPESVKFRNGESLADVRSRWRDFCRVAGAYPSPLVVVTHDVIVRLAVIDARGDELSAFNDLSIDNGSVTELGSRINDTSHLGELQNSLADQAL
jgi:probable phosphoglycerate mutase